MESNNFKNIYQSKNQHLLWNENEKMITSIWTTSPYMEEEEYREELITFFEKVKELKPINIFIDAVEGNYSAVPETQEWVTKNYFPIYIEVGLKKLAWLMSKDIFAQVSFEQSFEETDNSSFVLKYFDDKIEALNWLKK